MIKDANLKTPKYAIMWIPRFKEQEKYPSQF